LQHVPLSSLSTQVGLNKLTSLEGLEGLGSLDLLDAHANRIEGISQLIHLTSLRIISLGGEQGPGIFVLWQDLSHRIVL